MCELRLVLSFSMDASQRKGAWERENLNTRGNMTRRRASLLFDDLFLTLPVRSRRRDDDDDDDDDGDGPDLDCSG